MEFNLIFKIALGSDFKLKLYPA